MCLWVKVMEKERMDQVIKKVCAINDLSCLGGASLGEIVPILSRMGIRTCPIPTVILSTHSGGYDDYTFCDLTDNMAKQIGHWEKLEIKFDAIYSGFLGSLEQISLVKRTIKSFKCENTLVVVDPVMGDGGEVYSSISKDIVNNIRKLISLADIITPNLTEAYLLADMPYTEEPSDEELDDLIDKLKGMGAKNIIITSLRSGDGKIATLLVEGDKKTIFQDQMVDADFPGTGDIFASCLIGYILNGKKLEDAVKNSCAFVKDTIEYSVKVDYSHRSGVLLEACLDKLI